MNFEDLGAVIESAKSRGRDSLERHVRQRLPEATEAEVQESVEVAIEIFDSIPLFLAAAKQAADERNLSRVVDPLLERAANYFMHPVDLMPEMTQGLAGLLDDSYLVLRILSNLERGPEPLVDWDLAYPTAFLKRLMSRDIVRQLDDMSIAAFQEVSGDMQGVWSELSHEA